MRGLIAWFARNDVAANLLMVSIIALGLYALAARIPLEVFPSFELDRVEINVSLPGATPAEAEENLAIRIEEAIYDLEGIEQLTSRSSEGGTTVSVDVAKGYDNRELMNDIKTRIDAISTLPDSAEQPVVSQNLRQRAVISLVLSGELSERELRQLGERLRDQVQQLEGISIVKLDAVRPYEISIEVSEQTLRRYGLTLAEVAARVAAGSLDLSAGNLRTDTGEWLIRSKGQAYRGEQFAAIPVVSGPGGTRLTLGELATIKDGFEEQPIRTRFNGKPAVMLEIYQVGNQNAIEITDVVHAFVEQARSRLPEGVSLDVWRDRSKVVKARLQTLLTSALQGIVLVIALLTLFLRPAIAFWVCAGLPVSFLGGLWLMPELDVTLNLISLFAFIMVLGILVDDAIVTGENIYTKLRQGMPPLKAAIEGTREVAVPVTFGVLTTVAAFTPLLMVEGVRGKIFAQIPMVVIPLLLFSLVESKLILPAHLKHLRLRDASAERNRLARLQQRVADGFEQAVLRWYRPLLEWVLDNRYLTLSLALGTIILFYAAVSSGWTRFIFFPRVPSETATASLTMPAGSPFEVTDRHVQQMLEAAQRLQQQYRDPASGDSVILNILATSGSAGGSGGGESHKGRVMFELEPPETRTVAISTTELVRQWRELIGPLAGAESLTFRAESGRGGDPLDIQLSGSDYPALRTVADQLKQKMHEFPELFDINDSDSRGKTELQLSITPQAQSLGLTLTDLARQVRAAFFGFQVQRIQRGRDDVRVYVRFPEEQRRSLADLTGMMIRTPQGLQVPFVEVAQVSWGRSPASITRIDRRRTLNVVADADKEQADIEGIKLALSAYLDQLLLNYPQLSYTLEGEAREQRQSFSSLEYGMLFVLFVIYALLAIPFRSYWQPLAVMSVIPFGAIGAIAGHWLMGLPLTIMSLMGMLALTGVVVNDSLVMVDYINRQRRAGTALLEAVRQAGVARFRAVILTSLTTFAGLMPLIFEKSTQAQFLIPMAVSLGFGILFATVITLLLVPVNYLLLDDLSRLMAGLRRRLTGERQPDGSR